MSGRTMRSSEKVEQIKNLIAQGLTYLQIEVKLGLSISQIKYIVNTKGIGRGRKKRKALYKGAALNNRIYILHKSQWTNYAITRLYCIGPDTVYRALEYFEVLELR